MKKVASNYVVEKKAKEESKQPAENFDKMVDHFKMMPF